MNDELLYKKLFAFFIKKIILYIPLVCMHSHPQSEMAALAQEMATNGSHLNGNEQTRRSSNTLSVGPSLPFATTGSKYHCTYTILSNRGRVIHYIILSNRGRVIHYIILSNRGRVTHYIILSNRGRVIHYIIISNRGRVIHYIILSNRGRVIHYIILSNRGRVIHYIILSNRGRVIHYIILSNRGRGYTLHYTIT